MAKRILSYSIFIYFVLLFALAVAGILHHDRIKPKPIKTLPDFSAISNIKEKKQAFFDFLTPLIQKENRYILAERAKILGLEEKTNKRLSKREQKRLIKWAKKWGVNSENSDNTKIITELLVRVDTLPSAMVLAQAVSESAWGTSRFAKEANNLFGEWCFKKGCGLVPANRTAGEKHEVKRYSSIQDSVKGYFRNINTHRAYKSVRKIRAQLRASNKPLTAMALIDGLEKYSERGGAYTKELKSIIRSNKLE